MDDPDARLANKFAEFEKERDMTPVYEALDAVEAATGDVQASDVAARRGAISTWLRFLAALDQTIDPDWDPQREPIGVAPPLTNGVVHGSGEVDPATIRDPDVRARYVQALKASKEYAKQYSVQLQLRRVEERAMRDFERLIAGMYTDPAAHRPEFDRLLAASPVTDVRAAQLRALLADRDSSQADRAT